MIRPDRIERRNRRKAIVLTTFIYGSLLAFFLLKHDGTFAEYLPEFAQEWMGQEVTSTEEVVSTEPRP